MEVKGNKTKQEGAPKPTKERVMAFLKSKGFKNAVLTVLYPLISLAVVLLVWLIAAKSLDKPLVLPEPKEALRELFIILGEKQIYEYGAMTVGRSFLSFILSAAFAFLFSIIGVLFKPFHKVMSPIVTVLRAAPTLPVIFLAVIWFDYAEVPVVIGFLIAFPLLYSSFYTALTGVDKNLVDMAKSFNVSKKNVILYVYLPSIRKPCLESMKSVISLTLKVVVAAEITALTKKSLGLLFRMENLTYNISALLALTVFTVIISFILEGIFSLIIWATGKVR